MYVYLTDGSDTGINGSEPPQLIRDYMSPPKFHRGDDRSNSSVEVNGDLPPGNIIQYISKKPFR